MKAYDLSFIIPALNEQDSLPHVLKSIEEHTPEQLSYEIIVVDNGSTDDTVKLAKRHHAKVFVDPSLTIGGLRNLGVSHASAAILVFLDADILLTNQWKKNIPAVLEALKTNPMTVTGSRCGIGDNASWIERFWFKPLITEQSTYINSGHLITTSTLFERVGGFDSNVATGEDYLFSRSASDVNAVIENKPLLTVVHMGYPRTLRQFAQREIWHGVGDCGSIHSVLSSKVAIASFLFVMLHVVLAAIFICQIGLTYILAIAFLIVGACFASAIYKHRVKDIFSLFVVGCLYYVYYFSRFMSCLYARLFPDKILNRHR